MHGRQRSTAWYSRAWSAVLAVTVLTAGLLAVTATTASAAVGTCTVNTGAAGPVTFVNNTSTAVRVNWVGYDCAEVTYTTLAPGTSYSQATYTGHLWRIRRASDNVALTEALPALPRSVVTAAGNGICSTGSVAVPWSLTNSTNTALDLYRLDDRCSEVGGYGTLAAGATRSMSTYVGYRWRLKVAGTQKVVGETTVLRAGASTFSTAARTILPRATTDRSDVTSSSQVHVIYAVPSGGTDKGWDTNGRITQSVAAGNQWLSDQSGGRTLRMDTSGGALDITYVTLPRTAVQYASAGVNARDRIEADLKAKGYNKAEKKYLAYYEGTGNACGTSYWPPTLAGNTSVVFLQTCPPEGLTGDASRFSYTDAAWVHELFHGLGAAPTCAPHHTSAGHVSDDPADLMYAGSAPWRPALLDVGRDDYWTSGTGSCPSVLRSPYVA